MMVKLNKRTTKPGNDRGQESYTFYSLRVPNEIAEMLPEAIVFQPELHAEGLLYRPVQQRPADLQIPDWIEEANRS